MPLNSLDAYPLTKHFLMVLGGSAVASVPIGLVGTGTEPFLWCIPVNGAPPGSGAQDRLEGREYRPVSFWELATAELLKPCPPDLCDQKPGV